jgi:tetraacyldisaccharide-1-P 4'-kinase
MREPVSGLSRASAALSFGEGPGGLQTFRLERTFPALRNLATGERKSPHALSGKQVRPLCAIGDPEPFIRAISALGMNVTGAVILPDHDPIRLPLSHSDTWIVTDKDAAKLAARDTLPAHVYALEMEVAFEDQEAFAEWLNEKLGA